MRRLAFNNYVECGFQPEDQFPIFFYTLNGFFLKLIHVVAFNIESFLRLVGRHSTLGNRLHIVACVSLYGNMLPPVACHTLPDYMLPSVQPNLTYKQNRK